ncbi:MAG: hypothetical protein R2702_16295 [Acidimicrobiales bacterium]
MSCSPVPTPRKNEPAISAVVAAAWATIAGWIRMVGQVTPVPSASGTAVASPPSTLHTNGLLPCSSFQGWKWSETRRSPKPWSTPMAPMRTRSAPECSSEESE